MNHDTIRQQPQQSSHALEPPQYVVKFSFFNLLPSVLRPPPQLPHHRDNALLLTIRRLDPHPSVHTHCNLERKLSREPGQDGMLGRE